MGSSIFLVSFVDATKCVSFGGDKTDGAIDQSVKDGLTPSIYVLRYNSSSWSAIHDSILNANKTIVDELLKSETFRKDDAEGKIKGTHIISLVNKYLGDDYLRTHNSYRDFSLALNRAQSEAIVYEGQPIYG